MQQRVMKQLRGDAIAAKDGPIGSVKDLYFDDEHWTVRYLVVDTGKWLPGRKVLISPASLDAEAGDADAIGADLTRAQVESAPDIAHDMPVSRLYEEAHARHFNYPYYWTGPYLWGFAPMPGAAYEDPEAREASQQAETRARESHLRSTSEVVGYRIQATDGPLGHVEDFVIDDQDWAIDQMVVDTRDWLPGRKVLVSPAAVSEIDWGSREVRVRLTREEVKQSPALS